MSFIRRLAAIGVLAVASLLPSVAMADLLDDFEKLFNDVSTNYGAAIEAGPDSRLADDYGKKLSDLTNLAGRLQDFITRLQIEDINLRAGVAKLKEVFQQRLENNGKGQGKGMGIAMDGNSGRWLPTSRIKADIKKLREMGFTTDNGGSYQKKLAKQDGFDEFETLVGSYAKSVREVSDDSVNNEWRLLFDKRLGRMKILASDIQTKLLHDLPTKAKDYNFPSEVNYLDKFYKDLVAENEKLQSAKKAGSNSNSSSNNNSNNSANNKSRIYDESAGRTKIIPNIERIMKDVNYTLGRIQKGIVDLKGSGFTLEGKITREAKDKAEGVAVADDKDEVSKDIASMTSGELNNAIQKERDRIYAANVSMSAVSPIVIKYYVKTLTKSQRERYQDLVKKYQNRGNGDNSSGMAMKEIHGLLKNAEVSETKAELAKILESVRKDKEQFEKDLDKERYANLNK